MAKREIRPIRIDGNVAYVPLSRSLEAEIDAKDIPLVESRNWYALKSGNTFYAVTTLWHSGEGAEAIYLHRHLLGAAIGQEIDHADGNGLMNRRHNLRSVTHAENMRNRRMHCNNTSGFKGVTKRKDKWRASIKCSGVKHSLGSFASPEEAHEAYVKASHKLHMQFSRPE